MCNPWVPVRGTHTHGHRYGFHVGEGEGKITCGLPMTNSKGAKETGLQTSKKFDTAHRGNAMENGWEQQRRCQGTCRGSLVAFLSKKKSKLTL